MAEYSYENMVPQSLLAFKSRPCALHPYDERYVAPTHEEVAALYQLAGWTAKDVAAIAGIPYNEKARVCTTVSRWKTSPEKGGRKISWSQWRDLLLFAGVISWTDHFLEIEQYRKGYILRE